MTLNATEDPRGDAGSDPRRGDRLQYQPRRGEGAGARFRLIVEEAGFVAKGELFRIYGEAADPVIVTVDAYAVDVEGQSGWQLDMLVHVLIDGVVEERRWRFWVTLDPDGFPAVVRATHISRNKDE